MRFQASHAKARLSSSSLGKEGHFFCTRLTPVTTITHALFALFALFAPRWAAQCRLLRCERCCLHLTCGSIGPLLQWAKVHTKYQNSAVILRLALPQKVSVDSQAQNNAVSFVKSRAIQSKQKPSINASSLSQQIVLNHSIYIEARRANDT